jgi:hypothetical protein
VKMLGKYRMIGNIVAVREQYEAHAAHLLDSLHQRRVESRRIDQNISPLLRRSYDQVRPCAEAGLGIESAVVDIVHDVNREGLHSRKSAAARFGADRCGGASDERHQGAMDFAGIPRLMVNAGLPAVIAEDSGRDLPARIAINATGVHKEVARDILGEAFSNLSHKQLDSFPRRSVASSRSERPADP